MTAVLSAGVHSFMGQHFEHQMSEAAVNNAWRRQYVHQTSLPVHHWHENPGLMDGGMQDADLELFQHEAGEYEDSFQHHTNALLSPHLSYVPDANWGSDIELATPPTASLASEVLDRYHDLGHTSTFNQHHSLHLRHDGTTSSAQSPHSSYGGMSPQQNHVKPHEVVPKMERPTITRSITAPAFIDQRPRRGSCGARSPPIKRSASEDEDDEYIPSEDFKPRGRAHKRARMPHTAVERRYRENLNAHLDKLRQAVPSLASKRPAGSSKTGVYAGEGVKPSKCEVLNGAIEHIGALGKENLALQTENSALKSRLEALERWLPHK